MSKRKLLLFIRWHKWQDICATFIAVNIHNNKCLRVVKHSAKLVNNSILCHSCHKTRRVTFVSLFATGGGGRQRQKVKHKGGARMFSSEEQLREEQTQRLREEEWMVWLCCSVV